MAEYSVSVEIDIENAFDSMDKYAKMEFIPDMVDNMMDDDQETVMEGCFDKLEDDRAQNAIEYGFERLNRMHQSYCIENLVDLLDEEQKGSLRSYLIEH